MSVSLLMVAVDKGLSFILMSTCVSWLTCSEVMEKKLGSFFFLFSFFAHVAVASVGVSFIVISACLSRLTVTMC